MDQSQSSTDLVITPSQIVSELMLGRIATAAKLRVGGNSWARVAPKIGRKNAVSARQITVDYSAAWHSAYEDARRELLDGIEIEAIHTMQELMQSKNELVAERAAYGILRHCSGLRAQKVEVSAVPYGINKPLSELSTAEVIEIGQTAMAAQYKLAAGKQRRG